MSMAPANSASIADGPALKLFHSILVSDPMAFSNQPVAFPTIACGWVMLGNAPTRITVWARRTGASKTAMVSAISLGMLMPAFSSADHHRQHAGFGFFLSTLFRFYRPSIGDIGERSAFENLCCRIAHIQKYLVQRAVCGVAVDEAAQLLGISQRRQRPVNEADDLAQADVGRCAAQTVSALCPPNALHHAGILQLEQNEFQKLLRQLFFVSNVADADCALVMVARQHHHGLQRVQTFLGDLHGPLYYQNVYYVNRHIQDALQAPGQSRRFSKLFRARSLGLGFPIRSRRTVQFVA